MAYEGYVYVMYKQIELLTLADVQNHFVDALYRTKIKLKKKQKKNSRSTSNQV